MQQQRQGEASEAAGGGNVRPGARPPLKVLIVEDTLNMQVAIQDLVCAVCDAEIVGVVSSEAMALDWANAHECGWSLAIVDLTLDQGDGFSIVKRLKEDPCNGAVVVFSAFVTEVIRRHCHSLGADAVFRKTEIRELTRYLEQLASSH